MSRSFKKPYFKGTIKFFKKYANKVVRKAKNIADGCAYKKVFCSYDVCDYRIYLDDKEFQWQNNRK